MENLQNYDNCSADDRHQALCRLIEDELCHANAHIDADDLGSIMHQIGMQFLCNNLCIICNIIDLRRRINLIKTHMGCMAQCRGARGEQLREAGAIDSLLSIVWRLIYTSDDNDDTISLPGIIETTTQRSKPNMCGKHLFTSVQDDFNDVAIEELSMTTLDLAIASLGSLRDLACGSALNRAAFLVWKPPPPLQQPSIRIDNGVHVLVASIKRYDGLSWERILYLDTPMTNVNNSDDLYTVRGKKEIRLLTNALGVIRNSSHSTADVCQEFFAYGLVDLLLQRLIVGTTSNYNGSDTPVLPDATKPWREACYRTAGSLINLAEKCPDVAMKLASNRQIIYLLLETWGGANVTSMNNEKGNRSRSLKRLPLLHLGLATVLNAAGNGALEGGLDDTMILVLDKEKERKRLAQRREEDRKLQKKKTTV